MTKGLKERKKKNNCVRNEASKVIRQAMALEITFFIHSFFYKTDSSIEIQIHAFDENAKALLKRFAFMYEMEGTETYTVGYVWKTNKG